MLARYYLRFVSEYREGVASGHHRTNCQHAGSCAIIWGLSVSTERVSSLASAQRVASTWPRRCGSWTCRQTSACGMWTPTRSGAPACRLPTARHADFSFSALVISRSVALKAKSAWMQRVPDPSEAFGSCPGQRAAGCTYPAGTRTRVYRLPWPAGAQVRRTAQSAGAAEGGRVRHHRAAPRGRALGAPGGQPGLLPNLGAAAAGAAAPGAP